MKRDKEITSQNGILGIDNFYGTVWNEVQSKPIRTNFSIFIRNGNCQSQHKTYFENLLMLYKENIFECIFDELIKYHFHTGINFPEIEGKDIMLDKIILSDQIKKKYYGFGEEIGNKTKDIDNQDDETKDIDNQDDETKDLYENLSLTLYGEYYPNEKEIVIYVEAMKQSGKTGRDLEDLFLSVLIHEYFHAVHYTYCIKNGQHRPFSEENEIIVESLAASFEHYFCDRVLDNSVLVGELEKSWKKHSVLVYPYSGAKQILGTKNYGYRSRYNLEAKLYQIKRALDKQGIKNDRIRDLEYMLHELEHMSHEGLLYVRSYFMLSLVSMEQAQMDLLSKCL